MEDPSRLRALQQGEGAVVSGARGAAGELEPRSESEWIVWKLRELVVAAAAAKIVVGRMR